MLFGEISCCFNTTTVFLTINRDRAILRLSNQQLDLI